MVKNASVIQRITAIWALSEAAFGGVLHAFQVPFAGLFINAGSIIFITLIGFYGTNKNAILKATIIVLIVKATVSPHTPLNAFFAVTVQGLLGNFLFRSTSHFTASAITLGIFSMLQSSLQRIIVLTLIFGKNLWDSIDIFGNYLWELIPVVADKNSPINFSLWLIAIYVIIHVVAGVLIGIFSARIPDWIEREEKGYEGFTASVSAHLLQDGQKKRKKRKMFIRPGTIAIILLAAIIVILSYAMPDIDSSAGKQAIIMVVRSTLIMVIWYLFAGPLMRKVYYRFLIKKKYKYVDEVEQTIQIMPHLRVIVVESWNNAKQYKNIKRLRHFISILMLAVFTVEIPDK